MSTEGGQPLTVEDYVAIDNLFAQYSWAVATADLDHFESLFTADGVVEEPGRRFEGDGPDGVRRYLDEWDQGVMAPGRQQWNGHLLIEGAGRRCRVRSFLMVCHRFDTGATVIVFLGHCWDTLAKVNGEWRFENRTIEVWGGDVLAGFPRYVPVEKVG